MTSPAQPEHDAPGRAQDVQAINPLDRVVDRHDAEAAKGSTGKVARRGARAMGASHVVTQVTRVVSTIALAKLLTPEVFGIVSLVTVITGFFERFLGDTGTSVAVVREPELTQRLASSVFWFNVGLGTVTTGGFVLLGGPIANLMGEPTADNYVRALGCMALINALSYVQQALLRRFSRFGALAISTYGNVAVTAGLSVALAAWGFEVWALVVGNLAGSLIGVVLLWFLSSWRPSFHFARTDLNQIRKFSANMTAFNFFGYFVNTGDRLIVGRLLGTTALGYYGMSNRLLRYPVQSGVRPFREVVLPMLSRLQDDHRALGQVYLRSVAALAFVLLPTTVTISVLADPLVRGVLGPQWVPATPVISIIALTAALQSLTTTTGSLYAVTGRSDIWLWWGVGSAIVTIACYAIGANWGIEGVAWGFLAGIALLTYPAFKIPFRLIGLQVRQLLRSIAPVIGATGVSAAATAVVSTWLASRNAAALVQLFGAASVGGLVYIGIMVVLRPQSLGDVISLARRDRNAFGGKRPSEPGIERPG
jgi:PST family polysaccharide transporter